MAEWVFDFLVMSEVTQSYFDYGPRSWHCGCWLQSPIARTQIVVGAAAFADAATKTSLKTLRTPKMIEFVVVAAVVDMM